jgi:iron(III) transport system substrate-binding protein
VIYDDRTLDAADLPTSIDGFTDPSWKGRIGWAPTNASLQSFVTAYRVLKGDEAAKAWLEGIQANEPKVYDGNDAVLAAVAAGEIEVGFVNHYYLMRQLAEQGDEFPVRNHFLPAGDPGSLVNVAGAGILTTAPNPAGAQAFIDFLLSEESQGYFSTETFEYPLVDGIAADPGLPTLAEIESPAIDLSDLADLEGTLTLMQEAGVL